MKTTVADKILALSTAYKALTVALIESGALEARIFERQIADGVSWLERAGEDIAAASLKDELEGLMDVVRELGQRD